MRANFNMSTELRVVSFCLIIYFQQYVHLRGIYLITFLDSIYMYFNRTSVRYKEKTMKLVPFLNFKIINHYSFL